ncbi:hypothetical protein [Nitrososphaeria virus YSH_462411]|uniref:Uncharacterized protein n=1 Tax=Nitrososphaeria virus YSH_462411 TaxID=3071321 RepID=A0A976UAK6_9CAUD|nr:hypothetical protein QKV92_gp70 [Yangshan Harbor Nitrososphaeria virus]UVF62342.1 hypothetical protein [Nitrososphaeria virus YSH_462411]
MLEDVVNRQENRIKYLEDQLKLANNAIQELKNSNKQNKK